MLVSGIILIVTAIIIRYWLGKRKFERRNAFGLQQFDLAANAGFGLAQTGGDSPLLDARVPFQNHQYFVLAEADAELLLQNLVGLLAHNRRQVVH